MNESRFVIIGGGMAVGHAAKQFVELGLKAGELTILSGDTHLPYERPPLSKGFLAGRDTEENIRINSEDFYREHGIEVKLGSAVGSRVRTPARKSLAMQSGGEFRFEKLIVATGSLVRTLDIPGAQLASIQYLRSLDDSGERDVAPKWIESGQVVSSERLADVSHSVLEGSEIPR
jgi:3-phenylpropionate/trans-cinnamate dioxygenase ferredoxin reductase subunit